jgi:hypothetical protein
MRMPHIRGMSGLNGISKDLRDAANAALKPGERILYAAQPDWRSGWLGLLALFAFGAFWLSIAMVFFIVAGASVLGIKPMMSKGVPAGFGLSLFMFVFSLPFVGIGLGFLAAPFLGIRKARATVHLVTDDRIMNLVIGRDTNVDSFPFKKVNFVKCRSRANGTGTLEIGYGVEKDSDGDPRPLSFCWAGIPNAVQAEALIRDKAGWHRY